MDVHTDAPGSGCTNGGNYDITNLGWNLDFFRSNYTNGENCRWSFRNYYNGPIRIEFETFEAIIRNNIKNITLPCSVYLFLLQTEECCDYVLITTISTLGGLNITRAYLSGTQVG